MEFMKESGMLARRVVLACGMLLGGACLAANGTYTVKEGSYSLELEERTDGVTLVKVKAPASGKTGLEELDLSSSTSGFDCVGYKAFSSCSKLKRVALPSTVTNIDDKAFYSCKALMEIEIPSSVISIGDSAFSSCKALMEIEIPPSVISIGDYAFKDCMALVSVTIPASVTEMGKGVFKSCKALEAVEFLGDCPRTSSNGSLGGGRNFAVLAPYDAKGWPADGVYLKSPLLFVGGEAVAYEFPPIDAAEIVSGLDTSVFQELKGCVMDETGRVMGMLMVKVCKATVNGCQTTLTFHGLDGKMVASTASQIMGLSKSPRTFRRTLRDGRCMSLVLGRTASGEAVFTGWMGRNRVTAVRPSPDSGEAHEAVFLLPGGFAESLAGGAVESRFLPDGEPLVVTDRSLKFASAAAIRYAQDRTTGAYGWVVNNGRDLPDRGNLSGVRLSLTKAKGTFKGTFKAYSLLDTRLKSTSVQVTGVMLDGRGYGLATVKGVGSWPVLIQ